MSLSTSSKETLLDSGGTVRNLNNDAPARLLLTLLQMCIAKEEYLSSSPYSFSPAHFPSLAGDTSRPLPSTHTLIPDSSRYTVLTDSQAAVRAPSQNSGASTARNTASPLDDIPAPRTPVSVFSGDTDACACNICINAIRSAQSANACVEKDSGRRFRVGRFRIGAWPSVIGSSFFFFFFFYF